VDLTKPLLAMFTIKGRHYKVEYEGLHFLCLNCGIFGHYVEGCPKRSTESSKNGENQESETAKGGEHGQQPIGREVGDGGSETAAAKKVQRSR
jgi:hypothetical protein